MNRFKDPKEMRMALNGKMITMIAGVLLITTAIFTTLGYGLGLFQSAQASVNGDQDILKIMTENNITVGYMRFTAIILIIGAVAEILVGVFALRFNNRPRRADMIMKMAGGLLAVEIIIQILVMKLQMLLLSNLLMPICLLWGTWQLRKISKLYPDREFAVDPNRGRGSRAVQTQNKKLMDRAMAKAKNEEQIAQVIDEIGDEKEPEGTKEEK